MICSRVPPQSAHAPFPVALRLTSPLLVQIGTHSFTFDYVYGSAGAPSSAMYTLYVALSRGTSRTTTRVLVKPVRDFKQPGNYTTNVVFREVLQDMQGHRSTE